MGILVFLISIFVGTDFGAEFAQATEPKRPPKKFVVVLAGGGTPAHQGHFKTAEESIRYFKKKGLPDEDVIVLVSDANGGRVSYDHKGTDGKSVRTSRSTDLDGDGISDIDGPLTQESILKQYQSIMNRIEPGDQIEWILHTHGGPDGSLALAEGPNLATQQLAEMVFNFDVSGVKSRVITTQCYGGMLADLLRSAGACVLSAASATTAAFSWTTDSYITDLLKNPLAHRNLEAAHRDVLSQHREINFPNVGLTSTDAFQDQILLRLHTPSFLTQSERRDFTQGKIDRHLTGGVSSFAMKANEVYVAKLDSERARLDQGIAIAKERSCPSLDRAANLENLHDQARVVMQNLRRHLDEKEVEYLELKKEYLKVTSLPEESETSRRHALANRLAILRQEILPNTPDEFFFGKFSADARVTPEDQKTYEELKNCQTASL